MKTPHILKVLLVMTLLRNLFLDISKAIRRMVFKLSPIVLLGFVMFGLASFQFLQNCTIADTLGSNEFTYKLKVFDDNLSVHDLKVKNLDQAAMPLHTIASNNRSDNKCFNSGNLLFKVPLMNCYGKNKVSTFSVQKVQFCTGVQ